MTTIVQDMRCRKRLENKSTNDFSYYLDRNEPHRQHKVKH